MNKCIFCNVNDANKIKQYKHWFTIWDGFPVSKGHCLIILNRHVETFFEISKEEYDELYVIIKECKDRIDKKYNPNGFNIGINNGMPSGQSIPHLHIHIIPRYNGDVDNPRGGVRGVIPSKQNY